MTGGKKKYIEMFGFFTEPFNCMPPPATIISTVKVRQNIVSSFASSIIVWSSKRNTRLDFRLITDHKLTLLSYLLVSKFYLIIDVCSDSENDSYVTIITGVLAQRYAIA